MTKLPHRAARPAALAALAAVLVLAPAPTAAARRSAHQVALAVSQSSPTGVPGAGSTAPTGARVLVAARQGCSPLSTLDPLSGCYPVTRVIAGLGGDLAGAVANGVLDQVAGWMVDAARTINGFVVREEGQMTTPELQASWYRDEFAQIAALGAGLAGLVALIALSSAALRRDGEALAEIVYGIVRAGFGTGVVIAITVMALGVADGISNAVAASMSSEFFHTLGQAWSANGFGGFGSAALAFVIALVQVIAGLFVWVELLVRDAAVYLAVLFFPVALAAGIWPALQAWVRRLAMLLLMFVILKPVILIVLALAGNAAAAGLSFGYGGALQSVGTILVGVVIYAIAAFSPWTLMFLLGTEVGAMRGGRALGTGGQATTATPDLVEAAEHGSEVGGEAWAGGGLGGLDGGDDSLAGPDVQAGSSSPGSSGGGARFGGSIGGSGSLMAAAGTVAPALAAAAGLAHRTGTRVAGASAARIQVAAGRSGFIPALAGGSGGQAPAPPALAPAPPGAPAAPGPDQPATSPPAATSSPPGPPPASPPAAGTPASSEPTTRSDMSSPTTASATAGSPADGGEPQAETTSARPATEPDPPPGELNIDAQRALGREPEPDPNADARRAFGHDPGEQED